MPKRIKPRTDLRAQQLRRAYELMRERFDHQQWWPGETPFEVCIGAILTQNTSWTNVERAIGNLKAAGVLDARKMFALPETELAQMIRPAGYFNVKARRLRSFLRVLIEEHGGELYQLFAGETTIVRNRLLDINGVGPETADSLLLYAGGHHSFVVDAYTKRIFSRHGWCFPDADYDSLKGLCESALVEKPPQESETLLSPSLFSIPNGGEGGRRPREEVLRDSEVQNANLGSGNSLSKRLDYWQDYHAQLVMVGKHYCRKREPRCRECPLHSLMPSPKPST